MCGIGGILHADPEHNARESDLTARRHGPPELPTGAMTNVLVVCHGNLCRSCFGPEPARKTRLLGDFLSVPPHRVEDLWGHSDEMYAMTFEWIASVVQRLVQVLEPSGW